MPPATMMMTEPLLRRLRILFASLRRVARPVSCMFKMGSIHLYLVFVNDYVPGSTV
jgi:hypothetical protein